MKNNLKYALTAVSILLGSVYSQAQDLDSTSFFKIQEIQKNARAQYAPDQRTAILALTKADVPQGIYHIETTEIAAQSAIENAVKSAGIQAQLIFHILPDSSVAEKPFGLINLSVANLRTKPSHAAEMATQALLGTRVDILQKEDGNYRVRTPEGYISWVSSHSVTPMNAAELAAWQQADKLIYTHDYGSSYSQDHTQSMRVSDLVYGNIFVLKGSQGKFYEVIYPDQRTAFIPKSEAAPFDSWLSKRQLSAENILNSAKTMMGLPYLWGGTSVKGVDCSGFTKTSYFMNGVIIPRDASQQVLVGEPIDILGADGHFNAEKALKNLKPADLLFFAAGKAHNPDARVTHVALYLGNGEFIHSAGTVRINSMLKDAKNYDDFQTRTVVAARRYIGSQDPQIQQIQQHSYYTKNNK